MMHVWQYSRGPDSLQQHQQATMQMTLLFSAMLLDVHGWGLLL